MCNAGVITHDASPLNITPHLAIVAASARLRITMQLDVIRVDETGKTGDVTNATPTIALKICDQHVFVPR